MHTTEDYFRDKNRKAGHSVEVQERDESDDEAEEAAGTVGGLHNATCSAPQACCAGGAGAVGRCAGAAYYAAPGGNPPAYMCMPPYAHMSAVPVQSVQGNGAVVPPHHPAPPGMQYAPGWPGMPPSQAQQMYMPGMAPPPGMQHAQPGMSQPQPQPAAMAPQRAGAPVAQLVAAHHAAAQPRPAHLPPGQHPVPAVQATAVAPPQQRAPPLQRPPHPGAAMQPAAAAVQHPVAAAPTQPRKGRNHKNLSIEAPARSETAEGGAPAPSKMSFTPPGLPRRASNPGTSRIG